MNKKVIDDMNKKIVEMKLKKLSKPKKMLLQKVFDINSINRPLWKYDSKLLKVELYKFFFNWDLDAAEACLRELE